MPILPLNSVHCYPNIALVLSSHRTRRLLVHNFNIRRHITLSRSAVWAHLLRLRYDLVQILLVQTLDLDLSHIAMLALITLDTPQLDSSKAQRLSTYLHVNPNPHIQSLHIPNQMHRRLHNTVLWLLRHLNLHAHRRRIHSTLEASSIAGREQLFGVGFAFVAGAAKGFRHGEVDIEVITFNVAGAGTDDFGMGGIEGWGGFGVQKAAGRWTNEGSRGLTDERSEGAEGGHGQEKSSGDLAKDRELYLLEEQEMFKLYASG